MLHTKFQLNMLSRSGENDDFISFAIFSNSGHLEFSNSHSEALKSEHAAYKITTS